MGMTSRRASTSAAASVSRKKLQSVGSGCGAPRELGHGTAVLPTSETGWNYWETTS